MIRSTTFHYASDCSLLVRFGDSISSEAQDAVVRLLRCLESEPVNGVVNLHPAYTSILVVFDAVRVDHTGLEAALADRLDRIENIALPEPAQVEIPVCYGGAHGPDLGDVAKLHGLTPEEVVATHSSAVYMVAFLGFAPGFAYLTGLPQALETPRLPAPRKRVAAGSVGIGGSQTGVYPSLTPGGWRLIGRTPLDLFRIDREPMSLMHAGDHVRFVPISTERFEELAE